MTGMFENVAVMKECCYLRDRLGIRLAFLEDPALSGMLAARSTKGVKAAIHNQLVQKLKEEAAVKKAKGEELKAARKLLGPRGGLPTLKEDLLRLATLLHVEVAAGDTVDKLKDKLRPMVGVLKGTPRETEEPNPRDRPGSSSDALPRPAGSVTRAEGGEPMNNPAPEEFRTAGPQCSGLPPTPKPMCCRPCTR